MEKDLASLDTLLSRLETSELIYIWSGIEFVLRCRGVLLPEEEVRVRVALPPKTLLDELDEGLEQDPGADRFDR